MEYPRSPQSRSGRRLRNYLVERAEKNHQRAEDRFLSDNPDGADRECAGYRRDCSLPAREMVRGYAPDRVLVYEAELCDRCAIAATFDMDVFHIEYDDLPEKSEGDDDLDLSEASDDAFWSEYERRIDELADRIRDDLPEDGMLNGREWCEVHDIPETAFADAVGTMDDVDWGVSPMWPRANDGRGDR